MNVKDYHVKKSESIRTPSIKNIISKQIKETGGTIQLKMRRHFSLYAEDGYLHTCRIKENYIQ